MADATIRLDQPEIVDTDARLDAESRVVAALTVLLERVRITGAGERYMDVNVASEGLVHDADLLAKLDDVLIELNTKLDAGGEVALDAATLLALENIVVSGTVALDTATLLALENINATVSGTVTANLGTIAGVATETTLALLKARADLLATQATLAALTTALRTKYDPIDTEKATYTTSGDHTLIDPALGNSLQVVWLYAQAKGALDTGVVIVSFTLGDKSYDFELTGSQPFAHGVVWEGEPDEQLVVTTDSTAAVLVNADYREV